MKKIIKILWKNEFIKGSAIFTIASFLTSILNYSFNLLAARGLGPEGFGEISALFSYMSISSVPMAVMTLIIVQKIGSKGDFSEKFALSVESWFLSKLRKWWFLPILLMLTSPFISRITNLSTISSYFLIPLIILTFAGTFYVALLQGLKYFIWFSIISIIGVLLKLMGAVFVFLGIDGLLTIMTFLLISSIVGLFLAHLIIQKILSPKKGQKTTAINKRLMEAIFNRQTIITFLSLFTLTLFNNIDIIFVKKFLSPSEAGIYSSWSLFAKIILYFVGPTIMVGYIFFSDKRNEKNREKVLLFSLGALIIIGIFSFFAYKYFSSTLILILFGSKFIKVAPYLATASIFGSLYTMITFITNYFLARKSIFSLILSIFIPIYIGLLFIIPRTLGNIFSLNIYFSLFVTTVCLVACCSGFFYNRLQWKQKNHNIS